MNKDIDQLEEKLARIENGAYLIAVNDTQFFSISQVYKQVEWNYYRMYLDMPDKLGLLCFLPMQSSLNLLESYVNSHKNSSVADSYASLKNKWNALPYREKELKEYYDQIEKKLANGGIINEKTYFHDVAVFKNKVETFYTRLLEIRDIFNTICENIKEARQKENLQVRFKTLRSILKGT